MRIWWRSASRTVEEVVRRVSGACMSYRRGGVDKSVGESCKACPRAGAHYVELNLW